LKNSPSELQVALETSAKTTALVYISSPPTSLPGATLILGHGAGAGQRSAFMVNIARALAAMGIDVVTFNFPYTQQGRRIPDRAPILESCYRSVIEAVRTAVASAKTRLFIGGKSMGGRIATQVAAGDPQLTLAGLVLLGYPLHPPAIKRPMLFVQGSRDAFGTPAELKAILDTLEGHAMLYVVEGGDHSFKVSSSQPAKQAAVMADVERTIVEWISRSAP
jgi:uncharacterized protein